MKDLDSARRLAQSLVRVGSGAGLKMRAVLTRMEEPLGRTIGNALETREAIEILRGEGPPEPGELGVAPPAFLNGLAEAVGELRRYLLDRLRAGETERCEALMQQMDDIYGLLITVDYPDALTGGLRRTTDVTRGIVEKTRGDLTLALRQDALEAKLARLEGCLQGDLNGRDSVPALEPSRQTAAGTESDRGASATRFEPALEPPRAARAGKDQFQA